MASPKVPFGYWGYSLSGAVGQALLVAELDPAEVEDAVLHGADDALAAAGLLPLGRAR